jgi:methanol metabolism-related c-type cytochrome
VDWYTYSGFRRYHSECHVCHGPDGEGSTYAPALKESVKRMNYAEFYGVVVGGKQDLGGGENKVMPALGDNKNVMCYVDDIYVYLRARSDDSIERGRPGKHEEKPQSASDAERACLGDNN